MSKSPRNKVKNTLCRKCFGSKDAVLELPKIGVTILPKGDCCGKCHWQFLKNQRDNVPPRQIDKEMQ